MSNLQMMYSTGKLYDSSIIASDAPRSFAQYVSRNAAKIFVKLLRLNSPGHLTTEIVQAIQPVATVTTKHGPLLCHCGHGRLSWQARSFHTEEPQTVAWLDTLRETDVLWDVGANVGLYSIYAAKFMRCKVIAFEPESQNFALLVANVALNQVGERCYPASIAITDQFGLGYLHVRYITKGGAYNLFEIPGRETKPASIQALGDWKPVVEQLSFGASLDELALKHNLPAPSHLKIDVDGLEPQIIDGGSQLLQSKNLRSILIEINRKSERDMRIPGILAQHGFHLVSERSNWLSRRDRSREHDVPTTNIIFSRN